MSRLIDADALLQEFETENVARNSDIWHITGIKAFIENAPTAFDPEMVVEEIKKLDLEGVSMVEDGKYTLVRKNEVISLIQTNGVCNGRQKSCKYCYKKDCPLSTEKTLSDKWSDIVKKGGVE